MSKPKLHEFKVELNPNQYGFAEQAAMGKPTDVKSGKRDPLDHDGDGRKGGTVVKK